MSKNLQAIELTKKERELVEDYLLTGNWSESALNLGYPKNEAKVLAKAASNSPAMLAAVYVEIGKRLVEGAAVGFKVVLDMAKDPDCHPKLRLEAAKELLKLGGHVAPKAKSLENTGNKQLHELSLDDLRRQRDALEGAIADRSRPVIAPEASPIDANDIELLG